MTIEELLALIEELKAQIADAMAKIEELKAQGDAPAEQFTKFQKSITAHEAKLATYEKALNEAIAKFERVGAGGSGKTSLSIGQRFAQSAEVKAAAKNGSNTRFTIGVKDSDGKVITKKHRSEVTPMMPSRVRVRDFMTVIPVSDSSVDYFVESGYTNNAGVYEEGTAAGATVIELKSKTDALDRIAHSTPISKRAYQDDSQLAGYVDNRLLDGVEYKENTYIVTKIKDTSGVQTYVGATAGSVGDTKLDNIRKAIAKLGVAEYPAQAVFLNPVDLAELETTKGANGQYVNIVGTDANGLPTVWRVVILETNAVASGYFLAGAIKDGATLWDNEVLGIEVGNQHSDNFTKSQLTLLGEEFVLVTVNRPESFVYGTFGAPAAPPAG